MTLSDAIIHNDQAAFQRHLTAGDDLDDMDIYGFTPLIETAIVGRIEMARQLLKHGAQVDSRDTMRHTALHWAIDNNIQPLCELLLQHGADPNAYSRYSQPILVNPLLRGQTELKKSLYQAGADLYFAQDYISAKLLGHRFNLSGYMDIATPDNVFIEIDYSGFILEFSVAIIQQSLRRYLKNYAARPHRPYARAIRNVIKIYRIAAELIRYRRYLIDIKNYRKKLTPLLNSRPLLIPLGYEGHAIALIFYKDYFVRCDRGEFGRKQGTVNIYKIGNLAAVDLKLLEHLYYKKQQRPFIEQQLDKLLDLKLHAQLPIAPQTIGNCSWANIEAAFPALLYLLLQESALADNTGDTKGKRNKGDNKVQDIALDIFYDWQEWDKEIALHEALESFHAARPARQACKAALFGDIVFETLDYKNDKDIKRAEKLFVPLALAPYQYVLRSYLTTYGKHPTHPRYRNLVELMDICGVSISVE